MAERIGHTKISKDLRTLAQLRKDPNQARTLNEAADVCDSMWEEHQALIERLAQIKVDANGRLVD